MTEKIRKHSRIEHIFKFMEYDALTDWEDNFVANVETFYEDNNYLTGKQYDKLEEVFKRAAEA
jgi:hypothetical protein